MDFRNEFKCEINYVDLLTLRMRLSHVMKIDRHAINGKYKIRSLYFDSQSDKALFEKINGENRREKFRLRLYNEDSSYISLEKKRREIGLSNKECEQISKDEAEKILKNDIEFLKDKDSDLCKEFYSKMVSQSLIPKTIVDYTREPFVFKPGNVRVTIDYNIRTSVFRTDFLNYKTITIPIEDAPIILEVKWDEFLPDIIRDALNIPGRRLSAFSKYAESRIYG